MMTDAREALVARQREEYGETWDVLVPEVGWTLGRIIESVIEDALPAEHDHEWQRRQNVTSRGYRMPPYEVCVVDGCDAARPVDEPAAHPPAPPTVKPSVEDVARVLVDHEMVPCAETGSRGHSQWWLCETCGVETQRVLTRSDSARREHQARAVLALLPGRSEAEVKTEALREAAETLRAEDKGHDRWYAAWLRDRAASLARGEGS